MRFSFMSGTAFRIATDHDNWAPVRDEDNEIAATIAALKLAKEALGKPTYLVFP
jgi:hypothetical protein